jgi:hypothetical protein
MQGKNLGAAISGRTLERGMIQIYLRVLPAAWPPATPCSAETVWASLEKQ